MTSINFDKNGKSILHYLTRAKIHLKRASEIYPELLGFAELLSTELDKIRDKYIEIKKDRTVEKKKRKREQKNIIAKKERLYKRAKKIVRKRKKTLTPIEQVILEDI